MDVCSVFFLAFDFFDFWGSLFVTRVAVSVTRIGVNVSLSFTTRTEVFGRSCFGLITDSCWFRSVTCPFRRERWSVTWRWVRDRCFVTWWSRRDGSSLSWEWDTISMGSTGPSSEKSKWCWFYWIKVKQGREITLFWWLHGFHLDWQAVAEPINSTECLGIGPKNNSGFQNSEFQMLLTLSIIPGTAVVTPTNIPF